MRRAAVAVASLLEPPPLPPYICCSSARTSASEGAPAETPLPLAAGRTCGFDVAGFGTRRAWVTCRRRTWRRRGFAVTAGVVTGGWGAAAAVCVDGAAACWRPVWPHPPRAAA